MVINGISSSVYNDFGVDNPSAYRRVVDKPQVTQRAANAKYEQPEKEMDVLAYYQELCSSYPEISFRLEDREEGMRHEYWLGYNNSMNQIGENFGEMDQYSVEIDVAVIRKMQSDPEMERHVKGILSFMEHSYGTYQSMALADNCDHFCRFLELDEKGELVEGAIAQNGKFSTEEEVRKMWQEQNNAAATRRLLQRYEQECMDTLLKLGEHRDKFQVKEKDNLLVS